jgi:chromosome segregation ATPase
LEILAAFFMNDRELIYSARSQAQRQQSGHKAQKKLRKERQKTAVYFLLMALLWTGLVYGGYFLAREHLHRTEQHISEQFDELRQENRRIEKEITEAMQLFQNEVEKYKEEMQQIREEMQRIQEELELTGESITGTDKTRQSLQERMAELDKQLAALKEQLRKLEEAVRAL